MSVRETPAFKRAARLRRRIRVRKKVVGTTERPRLSVFRSNRHIEAQIIDDSTGKTLAAATSLKLDAPEGEGNRKVALAKAVGQELGKKAAEKGITSVVFDRGGYRFHGRVAAVAEGVVESGLKVGGDK